MTHKLFQELGIRTSLSFLFFTYLVYIQLSCFYTVDKEPFIIMEHMHGFSQVEKDS